MPVEPSSASGSSCSAGGYGLPPWWAWVQGLRLPDPAAQRTLEEYCLAATTLRARWKALDPAVAALASRDTWVAPVARLRCLRGVDTLTAVTVLLEVFDFRRFGTPRPFMSFVGLVPRETSSGKKAWRGSITKTGNPHLRRVLIEAAWHAQHRPRPTPAVQARRAGQPPAVVALAEQAEQRLHRRFSRLVARGKRPVIAATAVAWRRHHRRRQLSVWKAPTAPCWSPSLSGARQTSAGARKMSNASRPVAVPRGE